MELQVTISNHPNPALSSVKRDVKYLRLVDKDDEKELVIIVVIKHYTQETPTSPKIPILSMPDRPDSLVANRKRYVNILGEFVERVDVPAVNDEEGNEITPRSESYPEGSMPHYDYWMYALESPVIIKDLLSSQIIKADQQLLFND